MNILVLLKMVPDVVEELEVAPDGKSLDLEFLRLIVNDRDDHALEQALLLKEQCGGSITVLALDMPDIDDAIFAGVAKGADRAVKIEDVEEGLSSRQSASVLAQTLPSVEGLLPVDLVLTGCQAIDDLDGSVAPLLAHALDLPYVGLVTGVQPDESQSKVIVHKEFAGGVRGEYQVALPAVLGIQAAEKPPRYVPVSKLRAAMMSTELETVAAAIGPDVPQVDVLQMAKPEVADRAEIIEGSPEDIAARLSEILKERGIL
jgi:electron transfer flavoprotein beta subunit